ncbi:MAG: hypothetical protein J1F32_03875 [Erysipelotrichales bacterium]|nr:hypothetical protein [Erysipelotrichales bacterium]
MSTILDNQKKVVDKIKELRKKDKTKKWENKDNDHPEKVNPYVVALLVSESGEENIFSYRSEMLEGDHAEYNLFVNKLGGNNHSKDTLYVSLEPCSHDSRINEISCSELIVKAGIKKVYMGTFDPDILVRGNGYAYLKENGVDVKLFDEQFQKELIDENWLFFKDKIYNDENSRRFILMYNSLLSKEAIAFYLLSKKSEFDYNEKVITNYIKENENLLEQFYKECNNNNYISHNIKEGKRVVTADIGFKLAFYNCPATLFKGAYILVIDNTGDEKVPDKFDGPIIIAYSKATNCIVNIIKKLGASFNDNEYLIVRELLANAVFHKDYNSYSPIVVKIYKKYIEIYNPCIREFVDLDYLNRFEMPTNPVNGCLKEIAVEIGFMEGQGRGGETFKNVFSVNDKPYEIICNILKVKIPLNKLWIN